MRQLTKAEILTLAEQIKKQERWQEVRNCVRQLYGPNAVKVIAYYDSKYNDQDYEQSGKMIAYDEHEGILPFDFTLPFFADYARILTPKKLLDYRNSNYDLGELYPASEDIEALFNDALGIEEQRFADEPDIEEIVFDLRHEPAFPAVFMED